MISLFLRAYELVSLCLFNHTNAWRPLTGSYGYKFRKRLNFNTKISRYRKRFHIEVEPLIEQLVDKSKVEESMFKAAESQKQVRYVCFKLTVLRLPWLETFCYLCLKLRVVPAIWPHPKSGLKCGKKTRKNGCWKILSDGFLKWSGIGEKGLTNAFIFSKLSIVLS